MDAADARRALERWPRIAPAMQALLAACIALVTVFIVLPLRTQGTPLAMIYAEAALPNGIRPSPEELTLLRTLRNQALLAVRQRS